MLAAPVNPCEAESGQVYPEAAEGNRDAAFQSLDAAKKQEDWFLLWAKVTPELDPLRTDPRFKSLLDQLRLP